jgi:hypothetical protein
VFLQTRQSIFKETLAPHANDLAAGIEASGDSMVGPAIGGEENHLGADHLKIRQRILGGTAAQFLLLGGGEHYRIRASTWHRKSVLLFHDAIREWTFQLRNTLAYL